MNAFPTIDMAEVTRLTRAGRLMEATALLQGGAAAPVGAGEGGSPKAVSAPATIDMVAPSDAAGAWTAPSPSTSHRGNADRPERAGAAAPSPLRQMVEGLVDRFGAAGTSSDRAGSPADRLPEGARFEARTFTGEGGTLAYKLYVPSGHGGRSLPLVVMLHGCTQSPDDFATGTGMNALAEADGFLVAYPAQSRAANASRCWNWFETGHQARGRGEPALIAGLAQAVVREFGLDPARVYVAGLSAGGAAASVLAATYPDLFAAVGVHSGLACGAARDAGSAFAAMRGGTGPVRRLERPIPTIVFHGDRDRTVDPKNGDQVVAQATPGTALARTVTQGVSEGGMAYTRTVQGDASGRPVLEQWSLHGAGHAWAGGSARGSYTDALGPDASRAMIAFFRQQALPAK